MTIFNKQDIKNAIEQGNADELTAVLERDINNAVEDTRKEMMEAIDNGYHDNTDDIAILDKYNLRKLSNEEYKYFENAVESFEKHEVTFPKTTFNLVFEDLRLNHPLLSKIEFQNTTGVTEWLIRTKDVESAWWGPLCEEVKKKLTNGFDTFQLTQNKLSVAIFMCNAMLTLSPQWLERLIREMLLESMQMGIEQAVVAGTGVHQPIGMLKDLEAAVDPTNGYADKKAEALKDFSPKSLGGLMAKVSKGKAGYGAKGLTMVVNPLDYWNIVFPNLVYRKPDGGYVYDKLPIPIDFVESVYVPEGKAILGQLKEYFFGVASPIKIEDSYHYHFVERNTVYIAEMLANGRPKKEDSFLVLDISKIAVPAGAGA